MKEVIQIILGYMRTQFNSYVLSQPFQFAKFRMVKRMLVKFKFYSLLQVICDINVQTATFRDVLIHVGTTKDSPELREKIRRVRRQCVEDCKETHQTLMPKIKR